MREIITFSGWSVRYGPRNFARKRVAVSPLAFVDVDGVLAEKRCSR